MDFDRTTSLISRVATLVAILFFAVAGAEWVANFFGYTITRRIYTPGRLLEFAAIIILLVIAVLLRQVRDALRGARS
jgi:hypothetical protein